MQVNGDAPKSVPDPFQVSWEVSPCISMDAARRVHTLTVMSICKGVKGGYAHAVGTHIQKVNIKCLLNTLALIIMRSKNKCGHKQDLSLQHMGSKDTNLIEFFLNGSEIQ